MKTIKSIFIFTLVLLCASCINKTMNRDSDQTKPGYVKGGAKTGARSRASIMKGIMENISKLRELYNQEYKDNKPDSMNVTVDFEINYLGIVVASKLKQSNSGNQKFDSNILEIVNSIKFETIEQKKDITEVIYPFVFKK
jgi:TonB family protein